MTEISITTKLSHGHAHGGNAAAQEALKLWLQCAVGGADYSQLPYNDARAFTRLHAAIGGFEAAIEALGYWNSERVSEFQAKWRAGALEALTKGAGHLLAACEQVERGNSANASFQKDKNWKGNETGLVSFRWKGTFSPGRWISIDLWEDEANGGLAVSLVWDTGTGAESSYLGLPSMTDEAERPDGRREGGWVERSAR